MHPVTPIIADNSVYLLFEQQLKSHEQECHLFMQMPTHAP